MEGLAHTTTGLYAWIVYWDLREAGPELERFITSGGTLSFFAAYYDEYGTLYLPAQLTSAHQAVREAWPEKKSYITVVNDIIYSDGSSVEKNRELVEDLLRSSESMRKHAAEIADMAEEKGYGGVDMDFENLNGNPKLWGKYATFITVLQKELDARGLGLRVILEPRALDKAEWPKNTTYAVMLYNLYGGHSGPGPKASAEFIRATLRKARKHLGDDVHAALATGGYVWMEGMGVQSVTEKQAFRRLKEADAVSHRDPNSMAIYADLSGWEKMWFADGMTLQHWAQICRESGVDSISIWRLGGNEVASVDKYVSLVP